MKLQLYKEVKTPCGSFKGRLLKHGVDAKTSTTLVENASRPKEKVVATSLADLAQCQRAYPFGGPVLSLCGLPPRTAVSALQRIFRNGPVIYSKSRHHQ